MSDEFILSGKKLPIILVENYLPDVLKKELLSQVQSLNWTPFINRWKKPAKRNHWIGGKSYNFSGMTHEHEEMSGPILDLLTRINTQCKSNLNGCYGNKYLNNSVKLGCHSDDEKQLNQSSIIVSYSLGVSRRLWFKDKETGEELGIILPDNSLFIMIPPCQILYSHSVKEDSDLPNGVRYSLTFREFIS